MTMPAGQTTPSRPTIGPAIILLSNLLIVLDISSVNNLLPKILSCTTETRTGLIIGYSTRFEDLKKGGMSLTYEQRNRLGERRRRLTRCAVQPRVIRCNNLGIVQLQG